MSLLEFLSRQASKARKSHNQQISWLAYRCIKRVWSHWDYSGPVPIEVQKGMNKIAK